MILRAPHPALSVISDECTEDNRWLITELMAHFTGNAAAIAATTKGYLSFILEWCL